MPANERNLDAGMFMICLDVLGSKTKKVLATSCKAIMMPFKSKWRHLLEDLIFLPLEALGARSSAGSAETVTVKFFHAFIDDFRDPAGQANLEIKSLSVDFLGATFRMHTHFRGLRYLMYYYPISTSFFGISSISTVVFTLMYFCWRKVTQIFNTMIAIFKISAISDTNQIQSRVIQNVYCLITREGLKKVKSNKEPCTYPLPVMTLE